MTLPIPLRILHATDNGYRYVTDGYAIGVERLDRDARGAERWDSVASLTTRPARFDVERLLYDCPIPIGHGAELDGVRITIVDGQVSGWPREMHVELRETDMLGGTAWRGARYQDIAKLDRYEHALTTVTRLLIEVIEVSRPAPSPLAGVRATLETAIAQIDAIAEGSAS